MKLSIKKGHIVLGALVLALGAAVYLNWDYMKQTDYVAAGNTNQTTNDNEGTANYGDAYFVSARLSRTQSRDEAMDALKLKEISYIHCEAYAAGELKHGTISLITDGTPVIALATQRKTLGKMISNVKEVKARGAHVLLITLEGLEVDPECYDEIIRLPAVEDEYVPLLLVVTLQLIALGAANARGCDVDKPRNLAKSVTVE